MFTPKNKRPVVVDEKRIEHLLTRSVEDVFVRESLKKRLMSGERLRVKLGFDPTGPSIHIGRAITLWKLREFQELGHQVVFLVGDFTAQVGDPSDKLSKRPMLTDQAIKENLRNYKNLVGKIIDIKSAEFRFNSKWLSKLSFKEIAMLAEAFSVSQMSSRRNFKERLDAGDEVSLREFLYPLMQGYDSVALNADVEIGGFDQLFNVKAGRIIQKHYGKKEQDVLTTKMLEGTDGRKMSTSWGNVIKIDDEPADIYGKILSLRDELIADYYTHTTQMSVEEVSEVVKSIENGLLHPKDAKKKLAYHIVSLYYSVQEADAAQKGFESAFEKGGVPEEIQEVVYTEGKLVVDMLLENKLVSSKSDFRRLADNGAVTHVDSEKKVAIDTQLEKGVYKIGKKRFIKVV